MQENLISMYIDDELDLDEKVEFVEAVHESPRFKDETIGFLRQEKLIRSDAVEHLPDFRIQVKEKAGFSFWRPVSLFAAGLATALILFFFYTQPPDEPLATARRFVIYQPEAEQVEIAGSFTDWRTLPMNRDGASGYWEITLDVPEGEHRFSYILEGDRRLADPTILSREKDDFGGENSILEVNLHA